MLDVGQTVGAETGWKRFRGMVKRLSMAFALTVPREERKEITPHLAFFQRIAAIRVSRQFQVRKLTSFQAS